MLFDIPYSMRSKCWGRIFNKHSKEILLIGINGQGLVNIWNDFAIQLSGMQTTSTFIHIHDLIKETGIAMNQVIEQPILKMLSSKNQSFAYYLHECLQDKEFMNVLLKFNSPKGEIHELCCSFRVRKDWRLQIVGAICEAYDASNIPQAVRDSSSFTLDNSHEAVSMVLKDSFMYMNDFIVVFHIWWAYAK